MGRPTFRQCPDILAALEEKGFTEVAPDGMVDFSSHYLRSAAIVSTDYQGHCIKITDFALRFHVYGRIFHLLQLARIMVWGDRCHHYGAYKAHTCGLKGRVRNRYQWLRGAHFVIKAFSWRGVAQTMEDSSRLFLALHRREFVRQWEDRYWHD